MVARHQELAGYLSGEMTKVPGRVLEVGVGSGCLSMELANLGHTVCAIEPSQQLDPGPLIARGIRVISDSWPSSAIGSEKFDLVVSVQVVEHSPNPVQFMTALANVLALDGLAYVEVPSGDWLWRHRSPIEIHAQHVSYFSQQSLEILAMNAGLQIVGQRDIEFGRDTGLLLRRADSNQTSTNDCVSEPIGDNNGYGRNVATDCLALDSSVCRLRERVSNLRGRSALFGANAGTQSMLGWIPSSTWDCVLDDTPSYWGHEVYSEHRRISIASPEGVQLGRLASVVIAAYAHDVLISERLRNLGFLGDVFSLRPPSSVTIGPPSLLA